MKNIDDLRVEYKKKGYGIIRYDNSPIHSYPYDSPWLTDKEFNKIYMVIKDNTLVDRIRCYSLYLLAQQANKVEGDVLEVGTWRGGTAGILTQVLPHKKVYLADTFEGVVKASEWEHYENRAHADTSEELVTDFLTNSLGVSNFTTIRGVFPEKTGIEVLNKKLCFVYLDLDVYESTKDAFNYIWEQVSVNGMVVFDDYGMISACAGIKKFVDEIKDDEDKIFIQNSNGQAYIIKARKYK